MSNNDSTRAPIDNEYWIAGSLDHLEGRASRYDALVGDGCPYAAQYLAGWNAQDEVAEEFDRLYDPARKSA